MMTKGVMDHSLNRMCGRWKTTAETLLTMLYSSEKVSRYLERQRFEGIMVQFRERRGGDGDPLTAFCQHFPLSHHLNCSSHAGIPPSDARMITISMEFDERIAATTS